MRRLLWVDIILCLIAATVSPPRAAAQVLSATAGSSTFLNTSGFRLDYQWLPVSGWAGLSYENGARFGGFFGTPYRGFNLGIGDQSFPFVLDTDVFDPDTYIVYGRGVSVLRKEKNQSWMLFGGTTAEPFVTPFAQSYESSGGMGAFFYERRLSSRFTFHSFNFVRDQATSIQSLGFAVNPHWKVATAAGVGANHGFFSVASDYKRRWLRLTGSYSAEGNDFRRVEISALPYPERTGANLRVELTPWRDLRVDVDHETTLMPIFDSPLNFRATLDAASVSKTVDGFSLNGGISKSHGARFLTTAQTLDVTRHWGRRITTFGAFLRIGTQSSRPFNVFLGTAQEQLTPRFAVRETLTRSNGNTTASWGGSLLTNPVMFSLDYETVFNPIAGAFNGRPLLQTWAVNVQIQLPHGLRFHYDNFIDPFGKVRYTAFVSGLQYEPKGRRAESSNLYQPAIGRYVVRGVVHDELGHPVWGMAIQVDGQFVFSDDSGRFYVRFSRQRAYAMRAVPERSLNPGQWQVVSAPSEATAEPEDSAKSVAIVVRRLSSAEYRQARSAAQKAAASTPAPLPNPNPSPEISFGIEPATVQKGQSVTFRWNVANATEVEVEPQVGKVGSTGSISVTPSASTAYVLTATGPGGKATASASVRVTMPPLPTIPTTAWADLVARNMTDAYFDFAKPDLRPDARAVLRLDAQFLQAHPEIHVTIEGDCDDRGSQAYNLILGKRRAVAAKKYLESLGVPAKQMDILSFGKDRQKCHHETPTCWQKNRRVHFHFDHTIGLKVSKATTLKRP